jgi:inhibitor of KinA sporulation pathway (predicted exonuclease)
MLPTISSKRPTTTGISSSGFIIVDCEATCGPNINQGTAWCSELVQIAAIHYVLDHSNQCLKQSHKFYQYVKPSENPQLTEYFSKLTEGTITQEMVDGGLEFCQALKTFNQWRTDNNITNIPLVFSGDYDLGFIMGTKLGLIPNQIQRQRHLIEGRLTEQDLVPFMSWINIKFLFKQVVPEVAKINTESMTHHFGLLLSGTHHNALDDVESISKIAEKLLQLNPDLDWTTPTTYWENYDVYRVTV